MLFTCLLFRMYIPEMPKKKAVQIIYNRFESKDNTEPSKDSTGAIEIGLISKAVLSERRKEFINKLVKI
jgi:hypothetical protein